MGLNNWCNPSMKRSFEFGDSSGHFPSVMHEYSTTSDGVAIVVDVTLLSAKMVGLAFRIARAPPLLHPSLAHKLGHSGRNFNKHFSVQTCTLEANLQTSLRRKITQTSQTV